MKLLYLFLLKVISGLYMFIALVSFAICAVITILIIAREIEFSIIYVIYLLFNILLCYGALEIGKLFEVIDYEL